MRLRINRIPVLDDRGENVRTIQLRLNELGFDPGPLDGVFGRRTAAAIARFQKERMPGRTFEDGSLGIATVEALNIYVGFETKPKETKSFITSDLKGKRQRLILPELRRAIESRVFAGGNIPQAFLQKDSQRMACLVASALESMKIREVGGNNRGQTVGQLQSVIGGVAPGGDGLAWCMSICQVIVAFVEDYLQVESPFPSSEGVTDTYNRAKKIPGLVTDTPEVGAVACAQLDGSWMGHAMFVMGILENGKMATFEGNTNAQGSRDGHGDFFKTRDVKRNDSKTVLGFVRLYPNNEVPNA